MTQHCKHCERERLDDIVDFSCRKGGYCEWVVAEHPKPELGPWMVLEGCACLRCEEYRSLAPKLEPEVVVDQLVAVYAQNMTRHNAIVRPTYRQVPKWLPLFNHFEKNLTATTACFWAQPDIMFKPMGLMLWDLPHDAELKACRICNNEVVLASHGALPAKVFSRAQSYEDLKKLVEDGETLLGEWIESIPMTPANRASIDLSSNLEGGFQYTKAAFWGFGFLS